MKKLMPTLVQSLKTFPFSIGAFALSFVPLIMISIACINIKLNPAPKGYHDYRGEGVMAGFMLAFLLATIFILITIANVIHQKNKSFYAKLIVLTIVINVVWYGVLIILE